jgi:hypothetical protein
MLKWSPRLYMDSVVAKHPRFYQHVLKKHLMMFSVFCLVLPQNENNSIEIYNIREIWFRWERKHTRNPIMVIGIAHDRDEAKKLLVQMCEAVYQVYGTVNAKKIHDYFS